MSILAALILLQAYAAPAVSVEVPPPPTPAGRVVLYRRATLAGLAKGCPIRLNGQYIVELWRGNYAIVNAVPGHYIFSTRTGGVDVTVVAGETRYVACTMKVTGWAWGSDLTVASEEDFTHFQGSLAQITPETAFIK